MRIRSVLAAIVVSLLVGGDWARAEEGEDAARRAARIFGHALTSAQPSALRPVLPENGKVQLVLMRLGPAEGFFGASQVEAVFRNLFVDTTFRSFELMRVEGGASSALVHGRATLTDRQGHAARVRLYLALEPENDRWVLREIKETVE